jgi:hypothetical protein
MDAVSSLTDPKLELEQGKIASLQEALRLNLQHRRKTAREKRTKPKIERKSEAESGEDKKDKNAGTEATNFFL